MNRKVRWWKQADMGGTKNRRMERWKDGRVRNIHTKICTLYTIHGHPSPVAAVAVVSKNKY